MKYQVWHNLVLIIEDTNREIDVTQVSKIFNSYLFKTKEISYIESKLLCRIARKGNAILANALGTLDVQKMLYLLNEKYQLVEADEDLINKYQDLKFPKRNPVTGECHAGAFRHTFSIDEGVKPLVAALNKVKHVRTFSSCDGHGKHCLYVSYKVSKKGKEPHVLKIIETAFIKAYEKLALPQYIFRVHYTVGYTDFMFDKMHLYFSIQVEYDKKNTATLFNYIKTVSEFIK